MQLKSFDIGNLNSTPTRFQKNIQISRREIKLSPIIPNGVHAMSESAMLNSCVYKFAAPRFSS